jgi:hypothetical protein
MTATVNIPKTSVNFHEITWNNIPEDSHRVRRRENLNSHMLKYFLDIYILRNVVGHKSKIKNIQERKGIFQF